MSEYEKRLNEFTSKRCEKCKGRGAWDDAGPGDISYNEYACDVCNGTGFKANVRITPQKITEELNLHEQWDKDAAKVRTTEDLSAFITHLTDDYVHDYGTVVRAMCSAMHATFTVINESKQGGITGFQAGFIAWDMVEKFMSIKAPARIVSIHDMLYPQYESKFKTVSKEWWEELQKEANRLFNEDKACDSVKAHWATIINGQVPFGMTVEKEEES